MGSAPMNGDAEAAMRVLWMVAVLVAALGGALGVDAQVVYSVTSIDDPGSASCLATACTLRAAINAANSSPGTDTIVFQFTGAGPFVIRPISQLPTITDRVVIDGYRQPGASANSQPPELGTNAIILVEIDGSGAIGSSVRALDIVGSGTTVRGLVINHFHHGIRLGGVGGHVVEGNFIGTDPAGAFAKPNGPESGISVPRNSAGNLIGGTTPASRNVISGNDGAGIFLAPGSSGNSVLGNLIGTDASGTQAVSNSGAGVTVQSSDNRIGGGAPGEGNVISGNDAITGVGVSLNGPNANNNSVQGNLIGTTVTAEQPLGNGLAISIANGASNNLIGGTAAGEANTIAFNTSTARSASSGVLISGGTGNSILGNSIYQNDALGIELSPVPGVNANDSGDGDMGANDLQNYPVITSVTGQRVAGELSSAPQAAFDLEFFGNTDCDASGFGQGEALLGRASVATDANGVATFAADVGVAIAYRFVTATATNESGSTSEFSQCLEVAPSFELTATPPSRTVQGGGTAEYTVTAAPSGPALTDPITWSCGGLPNQATCSFSPSSLSLGSGEMTARVTVATAARSVSPVVYFPRAPWSLQWMGVLAIAAMLGWLSRPRAGLSRVGGPGGLAARVGLALLAGVLISSCGDSGDPVLPPTESGTPSGSYTLTLTGTSGAITRDVVVTLVVQ